MVILAFSPNDVGDTFENHLVKLSKGKLEVISPKERAGGNFLGKILREAYLYHMIVRASSQSDLGKRVVGKIRTKVLGFPTSKDEMDGSMVWPYFQEGRIDEICAYCMKDVELTRKVYYKMTFEENLF